MGSPLSDSQILVRLFSPFKEGQEQTAESRGKKQNGEKNPLPEEGYGGAKREEKTQGADNKSLQSSGTETD